MAQRSYTLSPMGLVTRLRRQQCDGERWSFSMDPLKVREASQDVKRRERGPIITVEAAARSCEAHAAVTLQMLQQDLAQMGYPARA